MRRRAATAALAVLILVLSGCSPADPVAAPATATPTSAPAPGLRILGYPADADASADIERAKAAAGQDGRFILLDFGGTWSADCRHVQQFWNDGEVMSVLDSSYHVVSVDVGNFNRNMDLYTGYALGATGIPTFVLLSPKGDVLADSGEDYVNAEGDQKTATEFAGYLRTWAAEH